MLLRPWTLVCTALSLVCLALPATAQLAPPEYAIRESQPQTGTLVRRNLVYGSKIAINRKYADLSDTEKAALNDYYEAMAPGDEPPFPIDGLRPVLDAIRKAQGKLQLSSGELLMFVTVDDRGAPTAVKVMTTPDPQMTQFAAGVLMLTKYKPAVCRGQPCKMDFPFRFAFGLQ